MASSRKPSMASNCVTDKRISQWEELMRKFSEAHKEQFKTASLDIPRAERSTKFFPTGSQYEGSWDVLGMSGYGVYTFPSGVIYEGNFEDGMFHGIGLLRYENGIVVRGKFVKGVLTERMLQSDNMEYSEHDWSYCTMPDRRFEIEYETGLKPAGNANLTAEQPTRQIPPGYYDTGDGFYDPKLKVIFKHEDMTAIVRTPTILEQQWIVKNCRVNPEKPLGPSPDLYEKFTEPLLKPEPPPSPVAGVRGSMTSFRAQSMYEDFEIKKGFDFFDFGGPVSDSSSCYSDSDYFSSKKPFSQWDGLMRKYYKKNEEKCKFAETPVDRVLAQHEVKHYPTGSSYNGAVDGLGMNGYGEYTYPNGVVYRGDFHEGRFHGKGELVYNNGPEANSIIQGQWVNGVLTEQKILLNGNLEYDTHDWKYCLLSDRRYAVELETDLRLPGESLITPDQPPRTIPHGYYDTLDGFYNPKTKMVYNNDTTMEVKRGPSVGERKWIMDNCRKEPLGTLGPRRDLYEKWVDPVVDPLPHPEPLVGYNKLKSRSPSAAYQEAVDEVVQPVVYDSSLVR